MSDTLNSDLVFFSKLPLCGCGCPDRMMALFLAGLKYYDRMGKRDAGETADQTINWLKDGACGGSEDLFWLVLYTLDKADLTEHGTGIQFGWLTPEGEKMIPILEAAIAEHGARES